MLSTFRDFFVLLDRSERKKFFVVLALIMLMGLTNAVGVAAIFPLLAMLTTPETIQDHRVLSALYDYGGFDSYRSFTVVTAVAVFVLFISGLVMKSLATYAMTRFSMMRGFSISMRMLRGYLHQPYHWLLIQQTSALTQKTLSEVQQMVVTTMMPALQLISQSVLITAILCALFIIDPGAAAIGALALGGSYALIFVVVRRYLTRLGAQRLAANRARFKIVKEAMGGLKDIKFLSLEQSTVDRFRGPARRFALYNAQSAVIGQLPRNFLEMIAFGGMLLFLVFMLIERDVGVETFVPTVGLYAFAGLRLFPAMQQLYQAMSSMRFGEAALKSLVADYRSFEADEPVQSRPDAIQPLRMTRELRLEDARFAYPNMDRAALHGVSLTIRARTSVAFVGGTGAGKTTTADIILGLLEPSSGRLVVDDVEITPANRRRWRRSIGYVPQNIYLIDDTIAANIAFGRRPEEIDMAAVERAARTAALHDFVVNELPLGYRSVVGDAGVRLSGGQRQRIGIARALYTDPDILVFDEATSALDNITEREVMEAVASLGSTKTVVMIAHRLSTVRKCDTIFVMRRGRIVAEGSYDDLLERSDDFRRMAASVEP